MSNSNPPIEQHRFARSQTPESPRPVHIPEPSTIPVLLNQMDPVFNDTATYNIPSDQTFSPYGETLENAGLQNPSIDEQDAVQNFFREAESQAAAPLSTSNAQPETAPDASATKVFSHMPTLEQSSLDQLHVPTSEPEPKNEIANEVTHETSQPIPYGNEQNMGTTMQPSIGNEKPEEKEDQAGPNAMLSSQSNSTLENDRPSGIDYQSLLDTISKSTSTAPAAEAMTVPTTGASQGEHATGSLPTFPGLPPKPPPLQGQVDFPSYAETAQGSTFSFASDPQEQSSQTSYPNGQSNVPYTDLSSTLTSAPVLTEPPLNPFNIDKTQITQPYDNYQQTAKLSQLRSQDSSDSYLDPNDRPWTPTTKAKYETFLEDERRYVTEGIWDRFPMGSRLFVGNLPSEKVTKRDLFHYFHTYGRLAQISIKQAYGFVQYHDSASCLSALNAKQGVEIRGRKVHLEISKPQKNTRNAGTGGSNKNQARRRSRSPDRGQRRVTDYREDSGRRRDDFRDRRSPSPRGYHSRDAFRHGSASRDGRRSPVYSAHYGGSQGGYYGDDESSLPIPRREPRNVPDVQLIVVDAGVHQSFINWVEDGFRRKGLQASTLWLGQRLPLAAVVKRQIVEGVQAVVKLSTAAQGRSKIPLQVFDRMAGASNVNFNEYADLDVPVAADVVIQARQRERGNQQPTHGAFPQAFPPPSPYGQPPNVHFPQHMPQAFPQQSQQSPAVHQAFQYPPQTGGSYRPPPHQMHGPPTPASQPQNLQELLANLKSPNNPPTPQSAHSMTSRPDLAGLLGNAARPQGQQPPPSPYGQPQPYQNYGQPAANHHDYHQQPQQQQPGNPQQNVQNIMAELARYQR